MRDPREGVSPRGTIVTGAGRDRVPASYEPVLVAASDLVESYRARGSLYLYGSVATGQARVPSSDVDLWTINVGPDVSSVIGQALSRRFSRLCRAVNIRAGSEARDYLGNTDAAYGKRVFLRHYCVHLSGVAHHESLPDFPADVRAARGLNGDIAIRAQRWRLAAPPGRRPRRAGETAGTEVAARRSRAGLHPRRDLDYGPGGQRQPLGGDRPGARPRSRRTRELDGRSDHSHPGSAVPDTWRSHQRTGQCLRLHHRSLALTDSMMHVQERLVGPDWRSQAHRIALMEAEPHPSAVGPPVPARSALRCPRALG